MPPQTATADQAILWQQQRLYLLDQRLLPTTIRYCPLDSAAETATAIRDMVVRGAPAIGITAAFGVVLGARQAYQQHGSDWKSALQPAIAQLAASRPTAVNLFWALQRMERHIATLSDPQDPTPELLAEAQRIHQQDIAANHRMGELGAALIERPTQVITHCNAGALATGGYGTALGVIRSGWAKRRITHVFADETRPWMQGSRLTAWELVQEGIPVTLLSDSAAASRLAQGGIDWVIVGADRIAANGDVANKIGTYHLAIAARYHGVRVMVVAPTSTIDYHLSSGDQIPIETRPPEEILTCGGTRLGAEGAEVWNPVFDITPASLIDVIVTERGVIKDPKNSGV